MARITKTTATIQVRRDSTANWLLNKDVIPAAGEPCLDLDTGVVVYGNGTDTYEALLTAYKNTKIAADNVDGLDEWITENTETIKGLSDNNLTDELKAKLESSQPNVIEVIKVGGTAAIVDTTDKSVDIPGALQEALGVVKGTDAVDGISIAEDHTMTVNSLNISKLIQSEGDIFILDGGNSAS